MRAVVCEAFGGPEVLALRELPDPPPPGAGEVRVRLRARGGFYITSCLATRLRLQTPRRTCSTD